MIDLFLSLVHISWFCLHRFHGYHIYLYISWSKSILVVESSMLSQGVAYLKIGRINKTYLFLLLRVSRLCDPHTDLKIIKICLNYIRFSGIPSGSKSIKTPSRQWWYHFHPHMCDIISDQSARSISACCQTIVAACDTNKQLTVS